MHEALTSIGRPLDASTRGFMESRLDHDFGKVRVHADAPAAESARALNAHAYTIGQDIVFAEGRYAPDTRPGLRLLAHELAHVVQQSGNGAALQPHRLTPEDHPLEREAESVAEAVLGSQPSKVGLRSPATQLQRHKDDVVAYSGGQSGNLMVLQAGKLIYTAPAVSGHPGHGENEPGEGPIPTGKYVIHPGITQPPVSKLQGGVCGANGIGIGYQEITSAEPSPCSGAHYCNVPCPTAADPGRTCFTPKDCWGPKRIKIEGSAAVITPEGKKYRRDGFYIHGGNPKDAVSSGCIKSLDNGVFPEIQKLSGVKGAVPLCVGTACPPRVGEAVTEAAAEAVTSAVESVAESIGNLWPL